MDLKDEFVIGIRDALQSKGFEQHKAVPYFTLKEGALSKTIGLDISSFVNNRHTVTPNLFIRSDQIAEVMKSFDPDRFKGEYYFTVRTNQYWIAELYGRPEYKLPNHVLKDAASMAGAVENFISFMREVGFTFFSRFTSLADFDEWFNGKVLTGEHDFRLGNSGDNAKEGLVAARLNRNPRYEELYNLWIAGLTHEGKYIKTIETLERLKTHLDRIT